MASVLSTQFPTLTKAFEVLYPGRDIVFFIDCLAAQRAEKFLKKLPAEQFEKWLIEEPDCWNYSAERRVWDFLDCVVCSWDSVFESTT